MYKLTFELTHNNIRIHICNNCLHNVHVCVVYSYVVNAYSFDSERVMTWRVILDRKGP